MNELAMTRIWIGVLTTSTVACVALYLWATVIA